MENYEPATYGERVADIYDALYQDQLDTDSAVDFLVSLAGGGEVLELAIGTGRIALPLAERGVSIRGIDVSEAMIAKLRAKPGGSDIEVTMGDFADVPVEGRFDLVFLVFNTLFALTTQEEQLRCLTNVAEHLTDAGVFVVEAFVPDVARFDRGQRVHAESIELDRAMLDVSVHDQSRQLVDVQHMIVTKAGIQLYPLRFRYVWPSELDLMARLAGLRLRERWADWKRAPFGRDSGAHISVYERATPT